MATTQVKDGFNGGSDNQLKVNADGSINTNSTGTGTSDVNVVSSVLPTGASTSANQTNGNQKTQVVDGANTVIGPAQTITGTNYLPVVLAASATPGSPVVARSIQVAGSDGTNARTLSTDSTGKLNINTIAGPVSANLAQTSFATGSNSSIGTSAVQIIVASTPAKIGVTVKAANSNTGTVYVGNSAGVTAGTADATDGFELAGGESVVIDIDNVNKLYAIASAASQKVYWTAD